MWINPNHPNPPRTPDAPREDGSRLATFVRHGGEELRVSLAEFNGHPFLSLRVWAPGQDGQLWPVKGKGVSVKLREVAGLAEALTTAADQLGDGGAEGRAGECASSSREPRPVRYDAREPEPKPTATPQRLPTVGFDEFEGEDA